MTNEEAIGKLLNIKAYLTAGNPIWDADTIREAMDMAIEALENNDKLAEDLQNCLEMYKKKKAEVETLKQTQWIPCSERLPEVGEDVFISVYGCVCEAHLRASKEYFLTHKTKALVAEWNVGAWMPLPKPYEGGKE